MLADRESAPGTARAHKPEAQKKNSGLASTPAAGWWSQDSGPSSRTQAENVPQWVRKLQTAGLLV